MSRSGFTYTSFGALQAQRSLARADEGVAQTLERLSSGLRINHAADDAAGVALATSLQTTARLYTQATRNISDGISLVTTAQSALSALQQIVQRQAELAQQAANGSFSVEQRRALDTEANALVEEFNRIVATTKFNGISLLGGTNPISLQLGLRTSDSIQFDTSFGLSYLIGSGNYGTPSTWSSVGGAGVLLADMNLDGKLDLITAPTTNQGGVALGNGDGTFQAERTYTSGTSSVGAPVDTVIADYNGDGRPDMAIANGVDGTISIHLGNGDGTFQARTTYAGSTDADHMVTADFNGDGKADLAVSSYNGANIKVLMGGGDGSFAAPTTYSLVNAYGLAAADMDGDGKVDLVASEAFGGGASTLVVYKGDGNGSFTQTTAIATGSTNIDDLCVVDVNHDGNMDVVTANYGDSNIGVFLGNGDNTFQAVQKYTTINQPFTLEAADMNGDGITDIVTGSPVSQRVGVMLGSASGTFTAATTITGIVGVYGVDTGDINNDGVPDIVAGADASDPKTALGIGVSTTSIGRLNLLTQEDALASSTIIEEIARRVSLAQGAAGAVESRLSYAFDYAETARENHQAAAGRIVDADIAQEVADLVRRQVIQSAAAAVLAQANLQVKQVLKLLQDLPDIAKG